MLMSSITDDNAKTTPGNWAMSASVEEANRHSSSAETQVLGQHKSVAKSVVLVATVTLTMVINTASSTSFPVALPTIQKEMHLQEAESQWIVSAYSLSAGCLLIVCGRLADLYGRKKTFLIGSITLIAFTLGCSFAKNVVVLNVLRGLQGVGAAAQIPASLGILANEFPPSRARSFAFATFSAGAPIGGVFGTALGGILTEYTKQTWRSTLYLLSGLTALCCFGLFTVDSDQPSNEKDKCVDWVGAFLITAGLVQITFVLSQGELAPNKWATPYIIAILILGLCCIVAFLFWQRHLEKIQSNLSSRHTIFTPPPLLKNSIWARANGRLAAMMVVVFADYCAFLSWIFWVQLYFQNYKMYSPVESVVRFVPAFISGILCNAFVGFMAARIPMVWIVGIGTLATATASLLFATIIPDVTYWAFCFPAICIGVMGADFVFSSGSLFIAKYALPEEQSVAAALFNTMRQLGTAFGVTVTTVVYNSVAEQVVLEGKDPIVLYRAAQYTSFSFGIFATVIAVIAFRGVGVVGVQESKVIAVSSDCPNLNTPTEKGKDGEASEASPNTLIKEYEVGASSTSNVKNMF